MSKARNLNRLKKVRGGGLVGPEFFGQGLGIAPSKGGGSTTWRQFISGLSQAQTLDIDFGVAERNYGVGNVTSKQSAVGDDIAVALDASSWGGQSLAVVEAAQSNVFNGFTTIGSWVDNLNGSWSINGSQGANQDLLGDSRIAYASGDVFFWRYTATAALTSFLLDGSNSLNTSLALPRIASSSLFRIRAGAGVAATVSGISAKKLPGNHATQGTVSSRGSFQTGGVCRYDNADDNHLTQFRAQNGANTLLYQGTIDAVIAATQMLMGASGSGANRCWLAVTTAGFIAAGVGSESTSTIVGTTDVRGKTIVAALAFDGATVKLFLLVDGVATEEYSGAQANTPTTLIPFRLGAYNNNGTAAGFAKIDARSFKAAHKAMKFNEFQSIAAALAA